MIGGLLIGISNAFEGALGAYLFYRYGLSTKFDKPRDILIFSAMIFFILQPFSATMGVSVLYLVSIIPADLFGIFANLWLPIGAQKPINGFFTFLDAWKNWWIGNSLGQLIFAPLIIAWYSIRGHFNKIKEIDTLRVIVASISIFILIKLDFRQSSILIFTFSYPLFLWIGSRLGLRSITFLNLVISSLVVYINIIDSGLMSNLNIADKLFYSSVAIASLSFSSLLIYALLTERNRFIQQLQDLVNHDTLTGVANRRFFTLEAAKAIESAHRFKDSLYLVMIDIDHFKSINDKYGHTVGDSALIHFSSLISKTLRQTDIFGRIGGEEFALIIVREEIDKVVSIIDRLREHIKQNKLAVYDGNKIEITFSAGISELRSNDTLSDLLKKSDEAMYQAKEGGRDRVVVY